MRSTPPPRRRNQQTGASASRKQRTRSTIGVNPLDLLASPDSPPPLDASRPAPAVPVAPASDEPTTATPAENGKVDTEPDLVGAGQRVFAAWVTGTEGVLKALFEAQQSNLRANLSVLEASTTAQRQITHELTAAARQAQAAALQAFRTHLQDDRSRH